MTDYLPDPDSDSEKCVVVSVSFLEMIADTDAATKLISDMIKNGQHIVLALRTNEQNYNLSTAHIPMKEFSEVQNMITLSNPDDYDVLSYKHENGKTVKKFEKSKMFLLDIYKPCQNAITEYGGTAIETKSKNINDVRKNLKDYKLL